MKRIPTMLVLSLAVFTFAPVKNAGAGEMDVKVRGSAGQVYDSNITYAHTDRKADFITSLSTGATVSYENKRTMAELSADITQQLYWKYTKDNNTSEKAAVSITQELSKFDQLQLSESFNHSYYPVSFEEEFQGRNGPYSANRNRLDLSYIRTVTKQCYFKAGYGYDTDLVNRSDLADSYVNRVSLETGYALDSGKILFGAYDYNQRRLKPGGEAKINTLSGGVRYNFTEQLSLTARSGVSITDSYDSQRYFEPLWDLTLSDQLSETESATLAFSQRYSTSPYTADVFNSWQGSGGIKRQLSGRLSGSASAFYGQGKYVSLNIKDDFFGTTISLAYDITKKVKGNLSYTYTQTMSNSKSREYDRNMIFLGVSTEF